jgi:triacylglycerol esterase/lipase EstA (alpha/beta hydrolase family)
MSYLGRFARRLGVVAATGGASLALVATTSMPAQAAIPEGGLALAAYNYVAAPNALAGGNDWTCQPTAAHPNPVILLPGTFANIGANFVKLSPRLKNNGYCVFGFTHGLSAASLGRVGGLAPLKTAAAELDAFVERVQAATGAEKVDIVGHSGGGNAPMWYIKKLGGASEVAHYVGWAPSSHGTTLNGIATLADSLGLLGFVTGVANLLQFPGVLDQTYASDYTKELWADSNSVPAGPKYTVIATRNDFVVTPYTSQALTGPNVTNIVLQDKCPWDQAGHVGLFNDGPTMQLTLNALNDGPASFQPQCWDFGVQFL